MIGRDFQPVLADTREGHAVHYRIRYNTFCLETGFEPAEQFPDEEERDAYDARSVHFLVRNRHDGRWVATMRLILRGPHGLQIQHLCELNPEMRRRIADGLVAEASRLAIIGLPPGDAAAGSALRNRPDGTLLDRLVGRRASPQVLIKLLQAAGYYCLQHGIDDLACLMRPTLARLVTEMGIPISACGKPCQHRGARIPHAVSCLSLQSALDRIAVAGTTPCNNEPYILFSELDRPSVPYPARAPIRTHQAS